jgi:hypothetical protein
MALIKWTISRQNHVDENTCEKVFPLKKLHQRANFHADPGTRNDILKIKIFAKTRPNACIFSKSQFALTLTQVPITCHITSQSKGPDPAQVAGSGASMSCYPKPNVYPIMYPCIQPTKSQRRLLSHFQSCRAFFFVIIFCYKIFSMASRICSSM